MCMKKYSWLSQLKIEKELPPLLLKKTRQNLDLINEAIALAHERRLDSVELYSGKKAITRAMWGFGAESDCFDKEYHDSMDLCTKLGFKLALTKVLRVKKCGMVWAAPVCSSWIFLSRSQTKRTKAKAAGDTSKTFVKDANIMTDHTMVILAVAFARGCDIYVEQPTSSLMPEYPIAKELFQWANVVKVSTCLKAFCSESCKPLIVYTSSKRAVSLARKREFSETKLAVHDAHGVTGRSTALKRARLIQSSSARRLQRQLCVRCIQGHLKMFSGETVGSRVQRSSTVSSLIAQGMQNSNRCWQKGQHLRQKACLCCLFAIAIVSVHGTVDDDDASVHSTANDDETDAVANTCSDSCVSM